MARTDANPPLPFFPGGEYTLGDGFKALAWFDAEDASNRLIWAGQRSAIRTFTRILAKGGEDIELHRIG